MKYIILMVILLFSVSVNATTAPQPQAHMIEETGDSCVCKLVYGNYPRCDDGWGSDGMIMNDYVTRRCAENKSAKITKKTYIYNGKGEVVSVIIEFTVDDPTKKICRGLFDKNCVQE